MATIKATCPVCGEVDLTSADVALVVCSVPDWSYYAFDCPGCVAQIRKPADRRVVSLLLSGGVEVTHWRVPAEALEDKAGPPLTYDDLLDFALQLSGRDALAAAAEGALSG